MCAKGHAGAMRPASRQCEDCSQKEASFGLEGTKSRRCADHAKTAMGFSLL
jgi:hypothetical protein